MPDNQNTQEEIQELESHLKTLKQQARGDKGNPYMIPVAVLIAGILIAGAVVYSSNGFSNIQQVAVVENTALQQAPPSNLGSSAADNIKPVSSEDHIKGDLTAPVKIVEFSDIECPFCKRIHPTLQQVQDEYGDKVAWVYRHFPLDALHSGQ